MYRNIFSSAIFFAITTGICHSQVVTENIFWTGGENAGQLAGICMYTIPDNKPLSQPKTLVVDNNLPLNSVIYSFEHHSFLDFSVTCTGTGLGNSNPAITSHTSGYTYLVYGISFSGESSTSPFYNFTNNSGIAIRYTFRFNQGAPVPCQNCVPFPASGESSFGAYYAATRFDQAYKFDGFVSNGYESGKKKSQDQFSLEYFVIISQNDGKYYFSSTTPITQSFSVKADLIKIDDIPYDGTPLKTKYSSGIQVYANTVYSNSSFDIGNGGITIVRPSCQLKTKDYNIPMNSWVSIDPSVSPGAFPAYGGQIPVNIEMECSGQVDDTQISFEDANSATPRQDVGLYDTAGGTPIDGLAIQLLHNNALVPTDKTKTVISGLGATKTVADSMPLFDSTSIVNFSARYVQTGAIKMNGTDYTGPVTGKLNIWVTYN